MNHSFDPGKKFFGKEISNRDRAIFEAGISLGALFHQFIGVPLKKDKQYIKSIENAISESISIQPFIKSVNVKIDYNKLKSNGSIYDYSVLTGDIIDIKLVAEYENITVYSRIKYIKELDFPLMFIEKIVE
ncbi:MAG: dihydroneopterin aldolase family protein [Candidatus Helarchaeota archaeon]